MTRRKKMNFNKSKIEGSKNAFLSMTLILLLATTLMMAFAQPTSGQAGVPQPEKTTGFATVAPTLIGVGQTLTCNLWVNPVPTKYNYASAFNGYYGVTVTFVRPDGTKDTFMPTDETGAYIAGQMQSLGALYFYYKPQMAGNWSISFTMPAQNITDSSGTVQFLGCTSNTFYFTVQTEPVLAGLLNGYPWAELPNSNVYWSYPINANNREWYQISGDWTGIFYTAASVVSPTALRWQPYGTGPGTAHIVWDQPVYAGGIIGGAYGSKNYAIPQNFPMITGTVVMDGKVYVNVPNTQPYGQSFGQFRCIDEATGRVLYTANGSISCGLHIPGNTYGQSASSVALGEATVLLESSWGSSYTPYLWGSSSVAGLTYWNYYHPKTGALIYQIANATGGPRLFDGTVLAFGCAAPTGQTQSYVYRWNMTSVVNNQWWTGVTWKVPAPKTLTGAYASSFAVSSDVSVVVVGTKNQYWGYNADTGALLWNLTIPYPITSNEQIPLANVDDFIVWDATASTWHCYSMATGAELWETPSVESSPWASTWTVYFAETNDYKNVYFTAPDGIVRAYSLTDGHLIWASKPIPSTEYTQNAVTMAMAGMVMEGGNIYVYAGYSLGYQINPVPRFAMTICINATTGDITWTLNGGVAPAAAANGYIIGSGVFDGNVYCIGKGPTKTTVTAQQQVGGSVLIQGSVLDQSSASSDATLTTMFANGVPAISDANMSVWMDYLHMQNATLLNTPPACNGVPVSIDALDPNGNYMHVADVTSDGSGLFKYQWTPTTPGLYTVYATFSGSESYYSSYAATAATVATAAATTPTTTSAPSNLANTADILTYIAVGVIAIIIAIAIVGIVIVRILGKKQ
jgi:hypothetical protein